jgi:hypothetical protein
MPTKRMKPMSKPVIEIINELTPGIDAAFGSYVVLCYVNSRKFVAYRIEQNGKVIARPHSPIRAAQFINDRWSRFYGERKL